MGKIFKRTLATIMVVLMVLTSAPLSGFVGFNWKAFAIDDSQELILNTGNQITRAEWLHNLAIVFEMTVEDEIYPDNYFSDLEDTHEYYYDVLLNVNFGVVDVEAGGEVNPDGLVTRSFASHTLNFCLGYQLEDAAYTFTDSVSCEYPDDAQIAVNRGWFVLYEENFCPEQKVTDSEVKVMLDDAQAVIAEKVVDENYESQYTFDPSVIEIPDGTEITKEENTLTIINNPKALRKGDRFATYQNGIPKIYLATSVSVSEAVTTVTVDPDFDGNDLFLSIDAEGVTDVSNLDITPDADTIMTVEEVPEKSTTWQRLRGVVKLNKKYTFQKKIDLGGGFNVNCKVEIENPKVEYQFKSSPVRAQVIFDGDSEISFSTDFNVFEQLGCDEFHIGTIGVPGIGGVALYIDLSLGGSVALSTESDLRFGFTYTKDGGFSAEKSFKSKSFSVVAEVAASAGLTAKLGVTDAPVVNAFAYFKTGGKVGVKSNTYADGKAPVKCTAFSAYIYASFGTQLSIKVATFSKNFEIEYEIWNAENSPVKVVRHYEDGREVCTCGRGDEIRYFTPWDSSYGGSGLWGGFGSTGYGRDGKPYTIYTYSLNEDDEATITSYKGNAVALNIPEKLDGYKVVGISDRAFAFQNMRSVSIPDSVLQINAGAFLGCKSLRNVDLSKNVKKMGAYAFGDCDSLEEIEIPKSLEETYDAYYYDYYYGYCYGVFRNSDNFKRVTFEEGTTRIAKGLFASCENIESIDIPDTVTIIGYRAFVDCSNLKNIILSDSLTTIESDAFRNTAVERISIPDTVTRIDSGAFVDCSNLSYVELSRSLETMGAYAFGYCENLQSITIPKSLDKTTDAYYHEYIYGYQHGVFIGSDNLKKVELEEGATQIPEGLFANNQGIEEIVIPDTVTNIEYVAFANCKNLKSVKLSDSLVKIHSKAFRNTSITEIDIPDSVTEIADGAFADCKMLSTVKLSKTLSTMGAYAFACCESLTSIEIPKSLKTTTNAYYYEYIYNYHFGPFFGCNNLKTVTFEEGTTLIPQGLFANNEGLETIRIPETVTKIDYQAFLRCKNLKEVVLGDGLEEIVAEAFRETSLQNIKLPQTLKYIRRAAFYGTNLEVLDIPDSVMVLEKEAFRGCTLLNTVTLPDTLENIYEYMFEGCLSLKKIELPATITTISNHVFKGCISLEEVILNDKLTRIDSYAFENCDSLTSINIPNSVTSFGSSVFYDCDTLTNVVLGTGLTSLPASTFEHCDALVSVDLPYRTASIGNNAFKDCVKFTAITIPRATISIGSNVFSYPTRLTINGVAGTYAETYANEIGATFVDKQVNATAVTIDKPTVTLNKGQSVKLVMNVTPADFTDEVLWKSSDTDVATIADDGTLTAKNTGTATIKLTVGSVSATCKVNVVQPVASVNIDKSSVTMQALDTYQLKLTVNPDNAANKAVAWSSSASDIATVDQNGLVTALKKGEATIRVDAEDGSGKYDTCKIIVSNNGIIATSVSELESVHNYPVNCTDFWQYTSEGASNLEVTFDNRTNIEDGFDYLYIYDGVKKQVGKYTGTELSGKTIIVPGDTVRIQFASDDSGTEWGFKVTDVKSASTHEHSYTSTITQKATCTSTGTKTFSCSCGDTYTETILNLGHSYSSSYTTDTAATCTTDGSKSKHCTRSGCTAKTSVTAISATGHSYGSYTIIKNATCTDEGSKQRNCSVCEYVETTQIAALGHTEVIDAAVAPTCTASGKTAGKHCSVCNEVLVAQKVIPATGKHTGGTATCKVKAVCTVCKQSYGSLKAHTNTTVVTKATLSKDGKTEIKCSVCGAVSATTVINKVKTVKLSKTTVTYNGKTQTPSVTVKDSKGNTLKSGTDYTVTYPKKRKNIGKYTVTVTFKGNYSGTKKLTFEIVPAKVTLSKVTAGSKQLTASWKTVSGVTGYEVQYSTSNKFTKKTTKIVKIKSSKTKKTTIKKLTKGKKYYVRIRAYKTVNKKPVYGAWSSVKSIKVK